MSEKELGLILLLKHRFDVSAVETETALAHLRATGLAVPGLEKSAEVAQDLKTIRSALDTFVVEEIKKQKGSAD